MIFLDQNKPEQREKAHQIAPFLFKSLTFVLGKNIQETLEFAKANLSSDSIFKSDYFGIVDGYTLRPVTDWKDSNDIVGCMPCIAAL